MYFILTISFLLHVVPCGCDSTLAMAEKKMRRNSCLFTMESLSDVCQPTTRYILRSLSSEIEFQLAEKNQHFEK